MYDTLHAQSELQAVWWSLPGVSGTRGKSVQYSVYILASVSIRYVVLPVSAHGFNMVVLAVWFRRFPSMALLMGVAVAAFTPPNVLMIISDGKE